MKGKFYLIMLILICVYIFSNEYETKIVKLLGALFTQMNKLFNDNDDD